MNTKKNIGLLLLIFGAVLIIASIIIRNKEQVRETPNLKKMIAEKQRSIILITTDTTRPDYLQPYGVKNVKTPVLQGLADEGILMENAHSVAPLTLPAHTSIHTGLYPPQTGVRNNGTHFVKSELTTLAERFKAHGFRTAAFVSASVLERRYGLDQGFEIYDDDLSTSRVRTPRMVPDRPAEYTIAAASKWLDGIKADEPFFIWVHLYDPHAAYNPPPPYRDDYKTNLYAGEIAYMDSQIGKLLNHPTIKIHKDLAISVIGDHGESLGEHGENTHGILAYESTLHVPWIIKINDGPEGIRIHKDVSQVDLAPTLLELANITVEKSELAGISLFAQSSKDRSLYSESYLPYYTYGWAKLHVMRQSGWKLIDSPKDELYDLKKDPRELTNQIKHREEVAHDLSQELITFNDKYAGGDAEQKLQIDQKSLESLRALGYIAMSDAPAKIDGPRPSPVDMIGLHTDLEKARSFSNDKLYNEARQLLEGILVDDPNNLAAMTDLSQALLALKDYVEAKKVVEQALSLAPDNQQLIMMLAQIESATGKKEHAIKLIDQLIKLNPTNMSAWTYKVQILSQLQKQPEMLKALNEALAIESKHPLINALYAQLIEIPNKQFNEAELRLRKATARDPFVAYSWRILGSLLETEGHIDEAKETYEEGLKHTPDDPSLHALLAILLARAHDANAEAHLREAIRYENEFKGELAVSLGAILAEKGRYDEARKLYDQVLKDDPKSFAARNNKAIAMAQSGQMKEAVEELEKIVKEKPNYADAHNNLAVLLLSKKDYTKAAQHAEITVKLAPNVAEAWDSLGAAYLGLKENDKALEALNHSLKLNPEYWSALLHRGLAHVKLNQVEQAKNDLEKALANGGAISDAYFTLAQLYEEKLNNKEYARKYYSIFLKRYPKDVRANFVRDKIFTLTESK